jgi:tetratricopeptide (TPR) repeat protein
LLISLHRAGLAVVLGASSLAPQDPPGGQEPDDYSRAEELIKQGNFAQGAELASRFVAAHRKTPKAYNLLGIALTGAGKLDDANLQYREALALQPDFVPALKNLAINELTQQKPKDAQLHFQQAARLAPSDVAIQAYLGKIAFSLQDFRSAAAHFAKSGTLQADPTVASQQIESELRLGEVQKAQKLAAALDPARFSPAWHDRIGVLLAQYSLFQEAIPFLQVSHAAAPSSYETAYNLAVCFVETKNFSQAIDVLNHTHSSSDHAAEMEILLAEAYEGDHQTQLALDVLREAIGVAPQQEQSFVALAALCIKYESYDLGLQAIELGLRYHPRSSRLHFQRGSIRALQNQFDLAESDFQKAEQFEPGASLASAALAESYVQSGDYAKAVDSLRPQLKQSPNDSHLHYLFGKAAMLAGASMNDSLFAEAKSAMETAVRLNPQFPAAMVELSRIYIQENRLPEAERLLLRAQALDSQDPASFYQLAVLYRRLGDEPRALEMLNMLKKLNQEDTSAGKSKRRLRQASP